MATHSSVLAWRIPGAGEPGGLLSGVTQSWTRLKRLSSIYIQHWDCWAVQQFYLKNKNKQTKASVLFSTVAAPGQSLTSSAQGFLFSTFLPEFIALLVDSHLIRCEVISNCGFDVQFLKMSDVKHLFIYLLAFSYLSMYLYIFFEKMFIPDFRPILNWVICCSTIASCGFLAYKDINPLSDSENCQSLSRV